MQIHEQTIEKSIQQHDHFDMRIRRLGGGVGGWGGRKLQNMWNFAKFKRISNRRSKVCKKEAAIPAEIPGLLEKKAAALDVPGMCTYDLQKRLGTDSGSSTGTGCWRCTWTARRRHILPFANIEVLTSWMSFSKLQRFSIHPFDYCDLRHHSFRHPWNCGNFWSYARNPKKICKTWLRPWNLTKMRWISLLKLWHTFWKITNIWNGAEQLLQSRKNAGKNTHCLLTTIGFDRLSKGSASSKALMVIRRRPVFARIVP